MNSDYLFTFRGHLRHRILPVAILLTTNLTANTRSHNTLLGIVSPFVHSEHKDTEITLLKFAKIPEACHTIDRRMSTECSHELSPCCNTKE